MKKYSPVLCHAQGTHPLPGFRNGMVLRLLSDTISVKWQNKKGSLFFLLLFLGGHPAVDLKSKETVSCFAILVGCIKISAHHIADLKLRQGD